MTKGPDLGVSLGDVLFFVIYLYVHKTESLKKKKKDEVSKDRTQNANNNLYGI